MRRMQLKAGRDLVMNGATWTVTAVSGDGSITVRHLRHEAEVRLPVSYVERDVELAYAVTAHRAQGMTVDTTHTLVTDDTTREALYVAATRGRTANHLYEITDATLLADLDPPAKTARQPYEVLRARTRPQRRGNERHRNHPHSPRRPHRAPPETRARAAYAK